MSIPVNEDFKVAFIGEAYGWPKNYCLLNSNLTGEVIVKKTYLTLKQEYASKYKDWAVGTASEIQGFKKREEDGENN